LFDAGRDRTSAMARRFFADVLGNAAFNQNRIAPAWKALLARLQLLRERSGDMATIDRVCGAIEQAGAPLWAERLRREPASAEADPVVRPDWRDAWDWAAADAHLGRLDA